MDYTIKLKEKVNFAKKFQKFLESYKKSNTMITNPKKLQKDLKI